jgi:preprotein translocase SecF subunit
VFEWQFSIAAILALTHDVLSTIGLFALTNFEFNLATVAAILTIAGYSINDTVVVFDRVRENLRRYKSYSLRDILNKSLNETLSRTVMTSVTTLLALTAIVIFGWRCPDCRLARMYQYRTAIAFTGNAKTVSAITMNQLQITGTIKAANINKIA